MQQLEMFESPEESSKADEKYTRKVQVPIYEPKGVQPHIFSLVDTYKANRLIAEIQSNESITAEEKKFLTEAAKRHNVFNYAKIADYYAHASKEMQQLMEKSALIIIDFDKAIQLGYVKLSDEISQQFLKEYKDGK